MAALSLLGGFRLQMEGRNVEVCRSAQRLSAYLAIQDRPVSRERVACDLWPDLQPTDALARVRDALYRLRRVGTDLVEGSGMWLSLDERMHVDVRHRWHRARAVLAGGGGSHGPGSSPALDELAPRPLLPTWDEAWLAGPRHDLWLTCVRALECLAQDRADQKRFLDAEVACRIVIEAEPYRESAHLLLADVYLAEGNPGQALVTVREYASRVRRELGLDAGPAVAFVTRSIHRRSSVVSRSVAAGP